MKIRSWLRGLAISLALVFVVGLKAQQKQTPSDSLEQISKLILPDSTQAKVNNLRRLSEAFEKVLIEDSVDIIQEGQEIKEMKQHANKLEFIANKVIVKPLPSPTIESNHPEYPDSLKLVIEVKRRGIFKRKN